MKVLKKEREMSVQFVKSSVSAFGLAPSDENRALRLVELCGRTAYKSEDKITEDSAKKFVLMLKSHGHLSVLEHSNIVLKVEKDPSALVQGGPGPITFADLLQALTDRLGFHRVFPVNSGSGFLMSGNFRSWIETLEGLKTLEHIHGFLAKNLNRFFPALFPWEGHDEGDTLAGVAPGRRGATGAAENRPVFRSSHFRIQVHMRPRHNARGGAPPGAFLYTGKHPLRELRKQGHGADSARRAGKFI